VRPIDERKLENAVLLYPRRIDRGGPKKQNLSPRKQGRLAEIARKLERTCGP
jgi:hypothetical protein